MGHSGILDTVGKIERAVTQPQLIELLSEVVDPDTLVPYSEAIGHQPRFEPYGDVRDALERISIDRGATDTFARDVTIGALIRVAVAQQQQLNELRAELHEALAAKTAKRRSKAHVSAAREK